MCTSMCTTLQHKRSIHVSVAELTIFFVIKYIKKAAQIGQLDGGVGRARTYDLHDVKTGEIRKRSQDQQAVCMLPAYRCRLGLLGLDEV